MGRIYNNLSLIILLNYGYSVTVIEAVINMVRQLPIFSVPDGPRRCGYADKACNTESILCLLSFIADLLVRVVLSALTICLDKFLTLSTSIFPILARNSFFRQLYGQQEWTMPINTTLFGGIGTVLEKAAEVVETFDQIWAEKDNPQTKMEVHQNLMKETAKLQAVQERMEIFLSRTEQNINGFRKTWMDIEMRIDRYAYVYFQKGGQRVWKPLSRPMYVSIHARDANQKKQEAKAVDSRSTARARLDLTQFQYEIEQLQDFIGNCSDNDVRKQVQRKVVFLNRISEEHRFLLRKVEWMTKRLDDNLEGSGSISDNFNSDSVLSLANALKSYLIKAHKDHLERIYGDMGLDEIAVEPNEMIGCLPIEILLEAFADLDGASQHRLRRTCSSWDRLLSNPLLRKYAMLDVKLAWNIFPASDSVRNRIASAFEHCLGHRTTHLAIKVGFANYANDAHPEDFLEDWLLGPILKKEYFQKAKHLKCIVLYDFAVKIELNMLAASLSDSVEKLIFRNVCLLARVEDSGLLQHTAVETPLDMRVVDKDCQWPWGLCIGFDAVQFIGDIVGPLSGGQRVQFAETVSSGQFCRVRQPIMTEMLGMQKGADDGQLAGDIGEGKHPFLVGQYKPWIQQLAFAYMIKYLKEQQRLTELYVYPEDDVDEYSGYSSADERYLRYDSVTDDFRDIDEWDRGGDEVPWSYQ